ncbi:hypothetical protein EDC04DRAFT_2607237 [Pisolithus marmoratus]|nr:hypothetical protein EDC04DRAFT_2607237 [Pisolithus marmoratus]
MIQWNMSSPNLCHPFLGDWQYYPCQLQPRPRGSVILNASNQRKMLVPTYHMDAEELEDQPVSPIKVVGHENFRAGLKHKQSDHDDNSYVTSSKVEDFNDGYEDHNLHFRMGPDEDVCVKMSKCSKLLAILTLGSKQVISEQGTVQSEEKDTATLMIANLFEIVEMVQE